MLDGVLLCVCVGQRRECFSAARFLGGLLCSALLCDTLPYLGHNSCCCGAVK